MNQPTAKYPSTWRVILRYMLANIGLHGPTRSLGLFLRTQLFVLFSLVLAPDIMGLFVLFATVTIPYSVFPARVYGALPVSRRGFGRLVWFTSVFTSTFPFALLALLSRGIHIGICPYAAPVLMMSPLIAGITCRLLAPPTRRSVIFRCMDLVLLGLALAVPILGVIGRYSPQLAATCQRAQFLILAAALPLSMFYVFRAFLASERIAERIRSTRRPRSAVPSGNAKGRRSDPVGISRLSERPEGLGAMLLVPLMIGATVYAMARNMTGGNSVFVSGGIVVLAASTYRSWPFAQCLRALRTLPMTPGEIMVRHFTRVGVNTMGSLAVAVAISAFSGRMALTLNCAAIVLTIPALCALVASMTFAGPHSLGSLVLGLGLVFLTFGGASLACTSPFLWLTFTLLLTPVLVSGLYVYISGNSHAYEPRQALQDVP